MRVLLSSFLDGQVSQRDRERIEGHLATCEACRRYQEELRAAVQAVRGLPQAHPPRSFTLAQAPRRRMAWAPPAWGAPLATATAAALFALLVVGEVAGLIGSPVARPAALPSPEAAALKAVVQPGPGAGPEAMPQPTATVGVPLGILGEQGGTPPAAKQPPTPEPTNTPVPSPTATIVPPPAPEAAQPPLQIPLLPWLQGAVGLLAVASGTLWLRRRRARS